LCKLKCDLATTPNRFANVLGHFSRQKDKKKTNKNTNHSSDWAVTVFQKFKAYV